MAERTQRFCFQNSCLSPRTTLDASSQDPVRRVTQLAKGSRGARWRSKLGWNFVGGEIRGDNNRLLFAEDTYYRDARIVAGNYATGDDAAAALETALNAAPLYLGSSFASSPPTLWLRATHRLLDFTAAVNGAAVTSWQSWEAGLHHVAETTNPPSVNGLIAGSVQDNLPNGYESIVFDGTNDKLVSTANLSAILGASGVFTMFLVVKANVAGGATQRILNNTGSSNWRLEYIEGSGSFSFTVNDGGTKTAAKAGTQDAFHVVTIMQDGSNIYIGVDDADTAALVATAAGAPLNTAETLTIGGGGTNPLNGAIAQIVAWPSALSEAERRMVVAQLVAEYAITDATTAPTWANTYAVTYDSTTSYFSLARSGGAAAWAPTAEVTTMQAMVGAEVAGDEGCHAEVGLRAASYSALTTYTSDRPALHSREWIDLDLGVSACHIGIFAGVNDQIDMVLNGVSSSGTIPAGLYETPAELVAAVNSAINTAWLLASYSDLTGKLTLTRVTYAFTMVLAFSTGANAGPEGASAHRTLGWPDTDVSLPVDGNSTTASYEVWGWNPTSTGIVIDHNSGGGGEYTAILSNQPIEGSRARGPAATSWLLRGDERIRIGQRGLYGESPVNLQRRYVRLMIDDAENDDAFNELSVFYAGPYLGTSRNIVQGYEHSNEPLSRRSRSDDGSFFLERRQPAHQFAGVLRNLTLADRTALEFLELVVGVGSAFFYLEDPQSKARIGDWTWYMVLDQSFRFRQVVSDGDPADRYETPVSMTEDLP